MLGGIKVSHITFVFPETCGAAPVLQAYWHTMPAQAELNSLQRKSQGGRVREKKKEGDKVELREQAAESSGSGVPSRIIPQWSGHYQAGRSIAGKQSNLVFVVLLLHLVPHLLLLHLIICEIDL